MDQLPRVYLVVLNVLKNLSHCWISLDLTASIPSDIGYVAKHRSEIEGNKHPAMVKAESYRDWGVYIRKR